jgi:hypothetical protein
LTQGSRARHRVRVVEVEPSTATRTAVEPRTVMKEALLTVLA